MRDFFICRGFIPIAIGTPSHYKALKQFRAFLFGLNCSFSVKSKVFENRGAAP